MHYLVSDLYRVPGTAEFHYFVLPEYLVHVSGRQGTYLVWLVRSVLHDEFVQFCRNADIWIYTSSDFDNTYATFNANLTDFKSVMNQQVFDTEGGGSGMWFEQRLAEPGESQLQWGIPFFCFVTCFCRIIYCCPFSLNFFGVGWYRCCASRFLQHCWTWRVGVPIRQQHPPTGLVPQRIQRTSG